jgi:IS5 family transposase
MHQTKKGNQWYFGRKAHIGSDACTGYVRTVTATAANVHDLDEATNLVRDDEFVYCDAGYQTPRTDLSSAPTSTSHGSSGGSPRAMAW